MSRRRHAAIGARAMATVAVASWILTGCATQVTPSAAASPTPDPSATTQAPKITVRPTPSPAPTPRFTNGPDSELRGILPATVAGASLVVVPVEEFGLTPGDVEAAAYPDLGAGFASLAIAYVDQPRLTLYALRADPPGVSTLDLEPHLASAGRYVGVAGLERDPWELIEAGGHQVWGRAEDEATAAGTSIYTWASGEFVFLLIGVDDGVNRALIAALPGEAPPRPSRAPSRSSTPSTSP